MRILFVASRVPAPPIQGDRLRAFHQLRLLGKRHQVILVAPVRNSADRRGLQAVAPFCDRVETVEVSTAQACWNVSRGLRSRIPWQVLFSCPPRLVRRVGVLAREESVDLIHIQLARMVPAVRGLSIPVAIDLIDALSLNFKQRAPLALLPLAWVMRREAEKLRDYEQALVDAGRQLVVTSPVDRAALGCNVHVVPNGVNLEAFPFVEADRKDPILLFCGRLAYPPNADAAFFFAREVFPLIRGVVPAARFAIAGMDPPARIRRLGRLPGVTVLGPVPSMSAVLAQAAVAVAPLRVATGIQNKVLEAMATGTPVVATPQALGGVPEARDGETCLVAEGPDALASACVRLLRDQRMARSIAQASRALVEAQYTWERSVRLLEGIYEIAVKQPCAVW